MTLIKKIGSCSLLKLTKSQCRVKPKYEVAGNKLNKAVGAEKSVFRAKKLNKKPHISNKIPTIRAEM